VIKPLSEILGPEFDFRFGDLIPHFSDACRGGLIRALCSLQIENDVDPMQWKFNNKYLSSGDICWFINRLWLSEKITRDEVLPMKTTVLGTYERVVNLETNVVELPVQNTELLDLILCVMYGVGNVVTCKDDITTPKDAIVSYLDRQHPTFRSKESLRSFTTVNAFGLNLVHNSLTTAAIRMSDPFDYCLLAFGNSYYKLVDPIGNTIVPRVLYGDTHKNLGKRCTIATAFVRCYLHRRSQMLQYRSTLVG